MYNPYMPMQDQLAQLRSNPMQYQQYQQPQFQQPQNNGMIWVQGEAAAKGYIVANGNTVPLWDSENQTIYIKSVDASGMPSMRILDYTERSAAPHPTSAPTPDYVTRQEFQAVLDELAELKAKKAKKKGDAESE